MNQNEFDPALLAEFLAESLEGIEEIPNMIIQLEDNPRDESIINGIFRPIHSLKGNSAYFGLLKIKALAHDVESLLDNMRSHRIVADRSIIDILIEGTDELQRMLLRVQANERETADEQAYLRLIERVRSAGETSQAHLEYWWNIIAEKIGALETSCESRNCNGTSAIAELMELIEKVHPREKKTSVAKGSGKTYPKPVQRLQQLLATSFEKYMPPHISQAVLSLMQEIREIAADDDGVKMIDKMIDDYNTMVSTVGFDGLLQELLIESLEGLVSKGTWKQTDGKKPENNNATPEAAEPKASDIGGHKKSLRVEEERIDTFLSYVGELIVVREMFEYLRKKLGEMGTDHSILTEFRHVNESFNSLSQNLQNSIMAIRKVPVKGLTKKIPRIIRDIASTKKKKIRSEIIGEGAEIDKSLLETLEAPLIHMVRNAADHGIEMPDVREENGKNPEGLVTVSFDENNDTVNLVIEDDGAGLDYNALKRKAVSLGLVEEKSALTEKNIIDLLFMSGVSTADEITDISGRGVGMDVVKQNIEHAGGKISVESQAGKGSRFTVKLPKAVGTQIIMGMTIAVANEEYVIPLERVTETFNIEGSGITDIAGKGQCITRRGQLLTILSVDRLLGIEADGLTDRRIIVSTKSNGRELGLVVHEVRAIQQVVLKKVDGLSECKTLFSGAAVTGSGKVAMVLDLERLTVSSESCESRQ